MLQSASVLLSPLALGIAYHALVTLQNALAGPNEEYEGGVSFVLAVIGTVGQAIAVGVAAIAIKLRRERHEAEASVPPKLISSQAAHVQMA